MPVSSTALDARATRATFSSVTTPRSAGLIFANFSDDGIGLVSNIQTGSALPRAQWSPRADEIKAIGSIQTWSGASPAWVEKDAMARLHLYYSQVNFDGQAIASELDYPFADGTNPQLLVDESVPAPTLIVDQSGIAPFDILVATIELDSNGRPIMTSSRFPATGSMKSLSGDYIVSDGLGGIDQFVVTFSSSPTTFLMYRIHWNAANSPDVSYQELGRGDWPFEVVDILPWHRLEDCEGGRANEPAFTTLSSNGDVYMWQYPSMLGPENYLAPFASFKSGTNSIFRDSTGNVLSIFAFEPDGVLAFAPDGDCERLDDMSAGVQRFPAIAPWSTFSRIGGLNSFCCGKALSDGNLLSW